MILPILMLLFGDPVVLPVSPEARVSGRVVGGKGPPYSGEVSLQIRELGLWQWPRASVSRDGSFMLEIEDWGKVLEGALVLEVEGAAPIQVGTVTPIPWTTVNIGEVELHRGYSVDGIILDDSGEPVREIAVLLKLKPDLLAKPQFTHPMTLAIRSGRDGSFRFSSVGPRRFELCCGDRIVSEVFAGQSNLLVRLGPLTHVKGVVTEDNWKAVPGAIVHWKPELPDDDGRSLLGYWEGVSDESGGFDIPFAYKGKGLLVVSRAMGRAPSMITTYESGMGEASVVLQDPHEPIDLVKLFLRDHRNNPIEGARIRSGGYVTTSKPDGEYELPKTVADIDTVRIEAGAYGRLVARRGVLREETRLSLPGSLHLSIEPGNVSAVLSMDSSNSPGYVDRTTRCVRGDVQIEGLLSRRYHIDLETPGYSHFRKFVDVRPGETVFIEASLMKALQTEVSGRVTEKGRPLGFRRVCVQRRFTRGETSEWHDVDEIMSDERGFYRLRVRDKTLWSEPMRDLEPTLDARVLVDAPPHPSARSMDQTGGMAYLNVPVEGGPFVRDFELVYGSATVLLRSEDDTIVRFSSAEFESVEDASYVSKMRGQKGFYPETASESRYTFRVPVGAYRLSMDTSFGLVHREVIVEEGTRTPVRIRFENPRTVEVESERNVGRVELYAMNSKTENYDKLYAGAFRVRGTGSSKLFTVIRVQPGTYDLVAWPQGSDRRDLGAALSHTLIEVPAGGSEAVSVDIR